MSAPFVQRPMVSVLTPTCGRPAMLREAVESVLAQSLDDWELLISDDEPSPGTPGKGWLVAQELAGLDPRIRAMKNPGERGQRGNMNALIHAARGEWIKPLYDDDALAPDCLERMLAAVHAADSSRTSGEAPVALARCLAFRRAGDRPPRPERRGFRAPVERLRAADALLAMFMQDVDLGTPTQTLVRRASALRAPMEDAHGLVSGVDSWWYVRLLDHGDALLVNEPLTTLRQGSHETITSRMTNSALDAEFATLRHLIHQRLRDRNAPSLETSLAQLELIRAAHDLRSGRMRVAIDRAARVRNPRAWRLFLRWAARRAAPGLFELVRRTPVREAARTAPPRAAYPRREGASFRERDSAAAAPHHQPRQAERAVAADVS